MEDSNRSRNRSIHEVSDPQRRVWLQGGLGALAAGLFAPLLAGCANNGMAGHGGPLLGFKGIPTTDKDTMVVPEGYEAVAFAPWGEPVGVPGNMPAWKPDASNSAADQAVQMGMHHDGIHYYPIDGSSTRGLLVDEPRVHRRRLAAPRRHEDLERREGAQVAGGSWRVGDRGRAEGRPLAGACARRSTRAASRPIRPLPSAARPPAMR